MLVYQRVYPSFTAKSSGFRRSNRSRSLEEHLWRWSQQSPGPLCREDQHRAPGGSRWHGWTAEGVDGWDGWWEVEGESGTSVEPHKNHSYL